MLKQTHPHTHTHAQKKTTTFRLAGAVNHACRPTAALSCRFDADADGEGEGAGQQHWSARLRAQVLLCCVRDIHVECVPGLAFPVGHVFI